MINTFENPFDYLAEVYIESMPKSDMEFILALAEQYNKQELINALADTGLESETSFIKIVMDEIESESSNNRNALQFIGEYSIYEWNDIEDRLKVRIYSVNDVMKYTLVDWLYNDGGFVDAAEYIVDVLDDKYGLW